MNRLIRHVRNNVVGYLALFVALGGTSYAAVTISNHSIVPPQFNGKYIGGYVRAWVTVDGSGRVLASAGGVHVRPQGDIAPGHYAIDWHPAPRSSCTATGSVISYTTLAPGYVVPIAARLGGNREGSVVQVYNALGQPAALPSTVILVCGTPH